MTVLSALAEAMVAASGEKATENTANVWPLRVCLISPVFVAQSMMVVSSLAEAMVAASGEKATDSSRLACPLRVRNCVRAPLPFPFPGEWCEEGVRRWMKLPAGKASSCKCGVAEGVGRWVREDIAFLCTD